MKAEQFDKILDQQIDSIRKVLASKRAEYAPTEDDRLHNFRKAAALTGQSLAGAAFGMAMKHIVSVADIVEQADRGNTQSMEMLDEKIGDSINYLILIKACLIEQRERALADTEVK